MLRTLVGLLLVLTSLMVGAQEQSGADVAVTVTGFKTAVRTGEYLHGDFVVTNQGPATARGVRFEVSAPAMSGILSGDAPCRFSYNCGPIDLGPGASARFSLSYFRVPAIAGRVVLAADVTSDAPDPNPSNNRAAVEMDVSLELDLAVGANPGRGYQPEGVGTIDFTYYNFGYAGTATNVVVNVEFPENVPIIGSTGDERFRCEIDGNRAVCRAGSLPVTTSSTTPRTRFTFLAPPLYEGGTFNIAFGIKADEADPDPRNNGGFVTARVFKFFRVANTGDDGPGSLREAILSANAADCRNLCTVGFRIPDPLPESGYFTIRPRSPLPALHFNGFLSGRTQKDLPGYEGPSPRVMIDGSLLGSGDGVVLQAPVEVDGLAIGNFPRYGVFVESRLSPLLDEMYLGVDGSGRNAAPNLRGVVTEKSAVTVTNSVVSGNVRSGIVIDAGTLRNNRIGVAAGEDLPIPNGASGVYLPGKSSARLSNNVIAHNREFGVAIDAALREVTLTQNSIFGNGLGIDYGLDGITSNGTDGGRFPNHPTVESARFDAVANQTIITVRLATNNVPPLYDPVPPFLNRSLLFAAEVYANSTPEGQAERFLGRVEARCNPCEAMSETRTLTVPGDLRGQWLSAVGTRTSQDCYLDYCSIYTSSSENSPTAAVR